MPQVGAHIVVADAVSTEFGSPAYLNNNRAALRLGGIGPDLMLFLFDPLGGQSALLNRVVEIYKVLDDVAETLDEIADKAAGPAQDLADWFTGGLSTELIELATLGMSALQHAVAMQLLPGTHADIPNPFADVDLPGFPQGPTIAVEASDLSSAVRMFGHPYTNDPPFKHTVLPSTAYDKWWWLDLLHYRKTGKFAAALQRGASSDLLKAYAAGYWSHVAADVCGHPYVNGIVGGPYRNHVMRHMVQENIIDSWVWQRFNGGADLASSRLNEAVDVGDQFGEIADHLRKMMQKVYTDAGVAPRLLPGTGGLPTTDDLVRAYRLMLMYLEHATGNSIARPELPPGSPGEFFQAIGSSLANTAGSIGESFDSNNEWWEWLLAPFLAAAYALVLLVKLATLPAAVVAALAAQPLKWLAYTAQAALYDFVRNARWMLALGGWGKVSAEELSRPFALTCLHLPEYRTGEAAFRYPHAQVTTHFQGYWLVDPYLINTPFESDPLAECCPFRAHTMPNVFIDGPGYDMSKDGMLRGLVADLAEPIQTVKLEHATFKGPQLGNAVRFAKMLIAGEYPAGSFDLDADRGYGFASWQSSPPDYDGSLT